MNDCAEARAWLDWLPANDLRARLRVKLMGRKSNRGAMRATIVASYAGRKQAPIRRNIRYRLAQPSWLIDGEARAACAHPPLAGCRPLRAVIRRTARFAGNRRVLFPMNAVASNSTRLEGDRLTAGPAWCGASQHALKALRRGLVRRRPLPNAADSFSRLAWHLFEALMACSLQVPYCHIEALQHKERTSPTE